MIIAVTADLRWLAPSRRFAAFTFSQFQVIARNPAWPTYKLYILKYAFSDGCNDFIGHDAREGSLVIETAGRGGAHGKPN